MNEKNEILLRAMAYVDQELLEDAAPEAAVPRRRRRGIAVVAGLAAVLALLIAAGIGFPMRFRTLTGQDYQILENPQVPEGWLTPGWYGADITPGVQSPVTVEDGKMYFTLGGEHIDLTGLADQQTPYIYRTTNPSMGGSPVYLAVGGTADLYGFAEIWYSPVEEEIVIMYGQGGESVTPGTRVSGTMWLIPRVNLWENLEEGTDMPCLFPWLSNAMAQLEADGSLPTSPDALEQLE